MIYDVTHVTSYLYETPVASARCALRLLPRDDAGQSVLTSRIDISPQARISPERADFFGNRRCEAQIDAPHKKLEITLRARVRVERAPPPAAALTPAWEDTQAAALACASLDARAPAHFLYPSRLAPLDDAITEYARESFSPRRPILEAAHALSARIHADFAYDSDATDMDTLLAEAFAARKGVCQDFTHIMIAGLRGLGLPAAYVSGYLRTIPPPGKPRLEGADATHAWVSVWTDPEWGWRDLDPTNAMAAGDDHIVAARGRDYADVAPVDGVIRAAGGQDLSVRVDVREIG